MNFDLDARSNRLEKEQQKRREDARKKREKELIIKANVQRLDEELRELNLKRKLEAEESEIEKQRLEEEERQLTGNINYKETLKPLNIEGEDDKVTLPESALQSLSSQDSFGKGAAVFQLTLTMADGTVTTTHCGVREFSAAAGTIGLPPKVINSLWENGELNGLITIKYVKLSKITYVKLQPKFNQFFSVEQIKMVLEKNLQFHSTLTLGDVITVWFRGIAHPLKIIEMKPFNKGILLDTDVVVDLDNSLENSKMVDGMNGNEGSVKSEKARKEGKEESTRNNGFPISKNSNLENIFHSTIGNTLGSMDNTRDNHSDSSVLLNIRENVYNAENIPLPIEPEIDSEDTVSIRVRTLAGNTINRRFLRKQPLLHLFEFASIEMKIEKRVLKLSTRFPNRVFLLNDMDPSVSFFDAGITSSQELFLASIIA